jgi:hypothetical protein
LRSWHEGDTVLHTSTSNFDGRQLADYALTRFKALKLEQRKLFGSSADLAAATQSRASVR